MTCQDERSQIQNKQQALKLLHTRVYDKMRQEEHEKRSSLRNSQVGSGDRSERIRTYNFPQSRITDHRISSTKFGTDPSLKCFSILSATLHAVVHTLPRALGGTHHIFPLQVSKRCWQQICCQNSSRYAPYIHFDSCHVHSPRGELLVELIHIRFLGAASPQKDADDAGVKEPN